MTRGTGRPNGRTPLSTDGKSSITTSITLPVDVIQKLDNLRTGSETRKDILVRIVREYEENVEDKV